MELGLFTVLFAGQPLEEALDRVVEAGLDCAAPDLTRFLAAGTVDPDPVNGLAPDLVRRAVGTTYVGHTGANAGWRTRILAIPGRDAGIVILTNSEAGEPVHTGIGCSWIAWMSETPTVEAACP